MLLSLCIQFRGDLLRWEVLIDILNGWDRCARTKERTNKEILNSLCNGLVWRLSYTIWMFTAFRRIFGVLGFSGIMGGFDGGDQFGMEVLSIFSFGFRLVTFSSESGIYWIFRGSEMFILRGILWTSEFFFAFFSILPVFSSFFLLF